MIQKIIEFFINLNFSKDFIIFLLSGIPIIEIKGALPVAIFLFKLSYLKAYFLGILGNAIVILFFLFFLNRFFKFLLKRRIFSGLLYFLLNKVRKNKFFINRYGPFGLMLFVAVPLPFTGAFTATFISYFLNMNRIKSFFMILLGIMLSGFIVLISSVGLIKIF